jgi:hypothetical protein
MRGTARLVDDVATAQDDIRHLAARYYGEETADRQVHEQCSKQERVNIYLAADRVTMDGFERIRAQIQRAATSLAAGAVL